MTLSLRRIAALVRWELRQLSRFPYGEIMLALFVFPMVLRAPPSAVLGPLTLGWDYAHDFLMTFGALNTAESLEDAYLPISLFAAILMGANVTGELQTSFGRSLLSTPLRKGEYYLSKLAGLALLLWGLSVLAIVIAVVLRGFDLGTLVGAGNATFWLGVVVACGATALAVAALATSVAVMSRSQSTTVLLSTALLVGAYFLGRATESVVLPPRGLGSRGLLYLANPSGATMEGYMLTLAAYLGFAAVVGFAGYWWFVRRWEAS